MQVAASHGRGVQQMLEDVLADVPEDEDEAEHDKATGLRLAVIGRPNVGKSTLVNRLLGEERVVVFDMPGTTRDSIYIPYERNEKKYTLIDYAEISAAGIAFLTLIYFLRNLIKKGIVIVSVFLIRHLMSLTMSIYGYFKDMVLQIRQGISRKNT